MIPANNFTTLQAYEYKFALEITQGTYFDA